MNAGRFVSYALLYMGVLIFTGFLFQILTGERALSSNTLLYLGSGLLSVLAGLHRIRTPALEATPKRHGVVTALGSVILLGLTGWFVSITLL